MSGPCIGVVIVTYCAADFIAACLHSLRVAGGPPLKVVVVDNASPDGTLDAVRGWAAGGFAPGADWPAPARPEPAAAPMLVEADAAAARALPFAGLGDVTLVRAGRNGGYGAGVNIGLDVLRRHPEVGLFWVLNPDSVVHPDAPAAFAAAAAATPGAGVIGGRVLYFDHPDRVQSDGGRVRWWMGFGTNVNQGAPAVTPPPATTAGIDYVSGGHMAVTRAFLDRAGLMDERWFIYFEEIDWILRRGPLPLVLAPGAILYHRAGATIGSSGVGRLESPFSVYFAFRNVLRFVARWRPWLLPVAYAAAWAVIGRKYLAAGAGPQALAALRGLPRLGPPQAVRARLAPAVWAALS